MLQKFCWSWISLTLNDFGRISPTYWRFKSYRTSLCKVSWFLLINKFRKLHNCLSVSQIYRGFGLSCQKRGVNCDMQEKSMDPFIWHGLFTDIISAPPTPVVYPNPGWGICNNGVESIVHIPPLSRPRAPDWAACPLPAQIRFITFILRVMLRQWPLIGARLAARPLLASTPGLPP